MKEQTSYRKELTGVFGYPVDENPTVPVKYGVKGIPTLMIFKDGQVAATKIGAMPKQKIKEWIESTI